MNKESKTKTRRKNKEDIVLDSLFWPVMPLDAVWRTLDDHGQPSVGQRYDIPAPCDDLYQRHDESIYSIWMHFVTYCSLKVVGGNQYDNLIDGIKYMHPSCKDLHFQSANQDSYSHNHVAQMNNRKSVVAKPLALLMDPSLRINPFINQPRLETFRKLSLSESSVDENRASTQQSFLSMNKLSNRPTLPTSTVSQFYSDIAHHRQNDYSVVPTKVENKQLSISIISNFLVIRHCIFSNVY